MKRTFVLVLVLTLLSTGLLPVFAYAPEDSNNYDVLSNNRYKRVIEREYKYLGARTITAQDIADRDVIVYAITETLNQFGPVGQALGYTISAGDYFYGRRETGTMYCSMVTETWYQEHLLTGARHHEATYYEFTSSIGSSVYTNRFRMR